MWTTRLYAPPQPLLPTTTIMRMKKSKDDPDASTLRVLLSTDNHLGYLECDPIRCLDSFAAFEEILGLARQHKVDMVLLSGDLFHENKPSRNTMHIVSFLL